MGMIAERASFVLILVSLASALSPGIDTSMCSDDMMYCYDRSAQMIVKLGASELSGSFGTGSPLSFVQKGASFGSNMVVADTPTHSPAECKVLGTSEKTAPISLSTPVSQPAPRPYCPQPVPQQYAYYSPKPAPPTSMLYSPAYYTYSNPSSYSYSMSASYPARSVPVQKHYQRESLRYAPQYPKRYYTYTSNPPVAEYTPSYQYVQPQYSPQMQYQPQYQAQYVYPEAYSDTCVTPDTQVQQVPVNDQNQSYYTTSPAKIAAVYNQVRSAPAMRKKGVTVTDSKVCIDRPKKQFITVRCCKNTTLPLREKGPSGNAIDNIIENCACPDRAASFLLQTPPESGPEYVFSKDLKSLLKSSS